MHLSHFILIFGVGILMLVAYTTAGRIPPSHYLTLESSEKQHGLGMLPVSKLRRSLVNRNRHIGNFGDGDRKLGDGRDNSNRMGQPPSDDSSSLE